jgi:hypothetical protein
MSGEAERQLNTLSMSTLCNLSYWENFSSVLKQLDVTNVFIFYRDWDIRRSCCAVFVNLILHCNDSELTFFLDKNKKMIQILTNSLTAFDSDELKNMSAFALCYLIKRGGTFVFCIKMTEKEQNRVPLNALSLIQRISFTSASMNLVWEHILPIVELLACEVAEIRSWAVNCIATLLLSDGNSKISNRLIQ